MSDIAIKSKNSWSGGKVPYSISYGKLMMWFFLLSDAFTFSALLLVYGYRRYTAEFWVFPENVFQSVPGIANEGLPLVFVGIMTFILIASSVTMVLAVEAGHRGARDEVLKYMRYTIILGVTFLGCQALEWAHLIEHGLTMSTTPYPAFVDGQVALNEAGEAVAGNPAFGQLFFGITGFHGFHVFTGVIILLIIYVNVWWGTYDKRGHYEMIEKVGLYWHFVDLVWVFVFTLFYLI